MKKEKRKKEVKLRKNFFLTLLITILLWSLMIALVLLVDPAKFGVLLLFFFLAFLSLTFTFSIIFINTRRGMIFSLTLVAFLILRYFGLGNPLNLFLLTGVGIATELYLKNR